MPLSLPARHAPDPGRDSAADDAGQLQQAPTGDVANLDAVFATLEQIAALPDDFQTAQFAPLGEKLQQPTNALDERTKALNDAQHGCAKPHAIRLLEH